MRSLLRPAYRLEHRQMSRLLMADQGIEFTLDENGGHSLLGRLDVGER